MRIFISTGTGQRTQYQPLSKCDIRSVLSLTSISGQHHLPPQLLCLALNKTALILSLFSGCSVCPCNNLGGLGSITPGKCDEYYDVASTSPNDLLAQTQSAADCAPAEGLCCKMTRIVDTDSLEVSATYEELCMPMADLDRRALRSETATEDNIDTYVDFFESFLDDDAADGDPEVSDLGDNFEDYVEELLDSSSTQARRLATLWFPVSILAAFAVSLA